MRLWQMREPGVGVAEDNGNLFLLDERGVKTPIYVGSMGNKLWLRAAVVKRGFRWVYGPDNKLGPEIGQVLPNMVEVDSPYGRVYRVSEPSQEGA